MKKSLKTFFAAFLSVLAFSLVSCNDVIFADIRNEVKLNDPTVSGSIQAIVRYKSNIYVANGRIYHQPKSTTSTGNWEKLETPETTIYNLAADNECLYAVSLSYTDDDDGYNVGNERKLWRGTVTEDSNGNITDVSWECLLTIDYSSTAFLIFCTNTPKEANRKAFFRYGEAVYKLSSSLATGQTDPSAWSEVVGTHNRFNESKRQTDPSAWSEVVEITDYYSIANSGDISAVLSATYLDNVGVILSPYQASTSNQTESGAASTPCVYTASGDDIYYSTDGSSWTAIDTDSDSIISMGFTQDFMLLGTADGIQHVTISSNVPGSSIQDFDNNAASALSSYYEVPALLVVNPGANEYSTAIFAAAEFSGSSSSTSATLDNVGLWGYYPSEDEWNRE